MYVASIAVEFILLHVKASADSIPI